MRGDLLKFHVVGKSISDLRKASFVRAYLHDAPAYVHAFVAWEDETRCGYARSRNFRDTYCRSL